MIIYFTFISFGGVHVEVEDYIHDPVLFFTM